MNTFQKVDIRRAGPEDASEILRWRNDVETRSMSRNGAVIGEEQHQAWFSRVVKDPLRILVVGIYLGERVGMVRFDRDQEEFWQTNIVIAPEWRGRGLGRLFLDAAAKYLLSKHPEAFLVAEIKISNAASRRLFSSLGFVCERDDAELLRFLLRPKEGS